jgi:hypothetical protein
MAPAVAIADPDMKADIGFCIDGEKGGTSGQLAAAVEDIVFIFRQRRRPRRSIKAMKSSWLISS